MVKNQFPIKVIFLGTPAFAVPAFEVLVDDSRFDVIAAYTQPDKPAGRKQIPLPPLVKIVAQKYNIPVYQPKNINDELTIEQIKTLNPDIIVVAAYGSILSKAVLDIPKYGCINIHASLLPRWRGASPVTFAILNGDKKTGITYIVMDERLDHGPILRQVEVSINPNDTTDAFTQRLSRIGADNLIGCLVDYREGKIKPVPQDESMATITKILTRDDGKIDWNKSAQQIECQIRAFTPWPESFCLWNNKRLKINKVQLGPAEPYLEPGKTQGVDNHILVGTGQGNLDLLGLQIEGKKSMSVKEFLNGNPLFADSQLK